MKHISTWQFFALSFFLFSMFLGAGNIIFAPPLGQAAGTNTWLAMSGFLISGVGLVLAAIFALSLAGGSIETLSSRVSVRFAKWFSIATFLTGWTTAIACLASVAEYFSRIFPKLNYRAWVIVLGAVSLVITNFGLNTVLAMASPVLYFLYPISITLIILVLFNRFFGGKKSIYVGAVAAAALMGTFDGLKDINMLPESLQNQLNALVPFYSSGMGWLFVALLGGIIGYVMGMLLKNETVFENSSLG